MAAVAARPAHPMFAPETVLEYGYSSSAPSYVQVDRDSLQPAPTFDAAVAAARELSAGKQAPPALVLRAPQGSGFLVGSAQPIEFDYTDGVASWVPGKWSLEGLSATKRAVHGVADVHDVNLAAVVDGNVVERLPELARPTISAFMDAPLASPVVDMPVDWQDPSKGRWSGGLKLHAEAIRSADNAQQDVPFRSLGMDEEAALERTRHLSNTDSGDRIFALVRDESGAHFSAPVGGRIMLPGESAKPDDARVLALDDAHAGLVALVRGEHVLRPS